MKSILRGAAGDNSTEFVDAYRIATRLLGDSIAANLFMLGYAWQRGLVPLSRQSIERAAELNGVAVKFNCQAFLWGRRAAHDREAVVRLVEPDRKSDVLGKSVYVRVAIGGSRITHKTNINKVYDVTTK